MAASRRTDFERSQKVISVAPRSFLKLNENYGLENGMPALSAVPSSVRGCQFPTVVAITWILSDRKSVKYSVESWGPTVTSRGKDPVETVCTTPAEAGSVGICGQSARGEANV